MILFLYLVTLSTFLRINYFAILDFLRMLLLGPKKVFYYEID